MKLNFLYRLSKNIQLSSLLKIRQVGEELFCEILRRHPKIISIKLYIIAIYGHDTSRLSSR